MNELSYELSKATVPRARWRGDVRRRRSASTGGWATPGTGGLPTTTTSERLALKAAAKLSNLWQAVHSGSCPSLQCRHEALLGLVLFLTTASFGHLLGCSQPALEGVPVFGVHATHHFLGSGDEFLQLGLGLGLGLGSGLGLGLAVRMSSSGAGSASEGGKLRVETRSAASAARFSSSCFTGSGQG